MSAPPVAVPIISYTTIPQSPPDGIPEIGPGATVQFCSDSACQMAVTDETGLAVLQAEAGSYTIHLLQTPGGYAADETEYARLLSFSTETDSVPLRPFAGNGTL